MTTFNKQETGLFLANGDFWEAVSADKTQAELDTQLGGLITTADAEDPAKLFGTMPDDTVVCIGTSPRRPRLN